MTFAYPRNTGASSLPSFNQSKSSRSSNILSRGIGYRKYTFHKIDSRYLYPLTILVSANSPVETPGLLPFPPSTNRSRRDRQISSVAYGTVSPRRQNNGLNNGIGYRKYTFHKIDSRYLYPLTILVSANSPVETFNQSKSSRSSNILSRVWDGIPPQAKQWLPGSLNRGVGKRRSCLT
jgi:hypothetical protein